VVLEEMAMPRVAALVSRLVVALTFLMARATGASVVNAGGVIDPSTLTPPPPSFEDCHGGSGSEITCHGALDVQIDPGPTGLICGQGASAFEVWDSGENVHQEATRFYNPAGKLTKRVLLETYMNAAFVNPVTGALVRYTQSNTITDNYSVPGDLASATESTTGNAAIFLVPGDGAVVLNAGRTVWVFDPAIDDLRLVSASGPQAFVQVFVLGDPSVLQPLCDALGG
jgi:hypothetical protein